MEVEPQAIFFFSTPRWFQCSAKFDSHCTKWCVKKSISLGSLLRRLSPEPNQAFWPTACRACCCESGLVTFSLCCLLLSQYASYSWLWGLLYSRKLIEAVPLEMNFGTWFGLGLVLRIEPRALWVLSSLVHNVRWLPLVDFQDNCVWGRLTQVNWPWNLLNWFWLAIIIN